MPFFPSRLRPIFSQRYGVALAIFLLLVLSATLIRIGLAVFNASSEIAFSEALSTLISSLPTLAVGLPYDIAVALWWALPFTLISAFNLTSRIGQHIQRGLFVVLTFIVCAAISFIGLSEFVFWNEFYSRFNFIAVDYLLYTREVFGNIRESYNLAPMFAGLVFLAAILTYTVIRLTRVPLSSNIARSQHVLSKTVRLGHFLGAVAIAILCTAFIDGDWKRTFKNPQVEQLAANGQWEFFYAVRSNQIDFTRHYATLPADKAGELLSKEFAANAHYRLTGAKDMPIQRDVVSQGKTRDMNVILVSIESMGAEFIESLGGKKGLTPNLEKMGREGLWFSEVYATGTRTVRGLEALTLSIPPTPGHAVPMRPEHTGLFTLGGVFKNMGAEPIYIYGGYSYFDNMRSFFGGNGYTVVDRSAIAANQITHENIWGVADEDLFDLALREVDQRHAQGKRVFTHVMTTSNHRPFTYPAGRIDIPSGKSREGAVKYTDYAIGRFIEQAKTKPWFDNTLFIFVADHTSIARGRSDLPRERYHIPMVWYAPKWIEPSSINSFVSQIDVAPSVLSWMNVPYRSEFFGRDVFRDSDNDAHIFMANYQTVGFVDDGYQVELRPRKSISSTLANRGSANSQDDEQASIDQAVAFYQVASARFATKR